MELDERSYEEGNRMAWRQLLAKALGELWRTDKEDPLVQAAKMAAELEDARRTVRSLCDYVGVEYPKDLHLADVVDKYLGKRLIALYDTDRDVELP